MHTKRHTPIFKIHKVFQLNTITLITSMIPTSIEASFTATSHRVNQAVEGGLGYRLPLLRQHVEEVVKGGNRKVVGADLQPQHVPQVLDGVHVGRCGWSIHPRHLLPL